MLNETLNATLERVMNRGVAASTTASALCDTLNGSRLAVRISGTGLRFRLLLRDGHIAIDQAPEADAEIAGSPFDLARLLRDPRTHISDGSVELTGDAGLAAQFSDLLRMALPDFEEELSKIVGDAAAREAGDAARGAARRVGAAARTFTRSLSEYLQEEKRALPTRAEVEVFMADVDELANDLARLEARIALLSARTDRPQDRAGGR